MLLIIIILGLLNLFSAQPVPNNVANGILKNATIDV